MIFRIYNLGADTQGKNLVAEPRLTDSNGVTVSLPLVTLDTHLVPAGNRDALVGLSLLFADAVPGKYTLPIAASEEGTNRAVSLQTEVQFK